MKSKTRKLLGVLFIILPPVTLILVLIGWSVFSFVIGQMIYSGQGASGSGLMVVGNIVNVALGFLGIVSIFMLPIGIIVGIVLLVKKDSVIETVEVSKTEPIIDNKV